MHKFLKRNVVGIVYNSLLSHFSNQIRVGGGGGCMGGSDGRHGDCDIAETGDSYKSGKRFSSCVCSF